MARFLSSGALITAVQDALALPPGTQRLVIEAEIGHPVRVYVKGIAPGSLLSDLVTAVKDVKVSPAGDVTPHPAGRFVTAPDGGFILPCDISAELKDELVRSLNENPAVGKVVVLDNEIHTWSAAKDSPDSSPTPTVVVGGR